MHRVLKANGRLIVITTNPESIGADYISYGYRSQENLKAGDAITCVVKTSNSFEIDDVCWSIDVTGQVLVGNGFTLLAA